MTWSHDTWCVPPMSRSLASCPCLKSKQRWHQEIYFLVALAADLVTLPAPAAAFSTALMTPTATV